MFVIKRKIKFLNKNYKKKGQNTMSYKTLWLRPFEFVKQIKKQTFVIKHLIIYVMCSEMLLLLLLLLLL